MAIWRKITISIIIIFILTHLSPVSCKTSIKYTDIGIVKMKSYDVKMDLYDVSWVYAFANITVGNTTVTEGTTTLFVSLRNLGSVSIYNLTVNFSSLQRVGKINETVKHYEEPIPPNYSVAFVFIFEEVYQNISLSEYDLPLYATYYADDIEFEQKITVPISVSGIPEIEIFAEPLTVYQEGEYTYRLKVRNVGTASAKWVRVITVGYPPYVTVESPDIYRIGFLKPNEEKEATFRLRVIDLPVTAIAFVVNVTFMDERSTDTFWVAETVPVIVNETAEIILVNAFSIPPTTLPGDKYVEIRAIIGNPTRKLIRNAKAVLELPEYFSPSFPSSDRINIGSLPPGYFVNVTFLIDVDKVAPAGFYEIPVKFTYDGGESEGMISIVVKEKVEFKIMSINPDTLEIGATDVDLHIQLKNMASVEAEDVYLEIQSGGNLKGELAAYVGKVFPGEVVDITFYTEVSKDAPEGRVPMDMLIVWIQEDRVLSELYRFMLTFITGGVYVSTYELGIGALFFIITIYLVYKSLREIMVKRRWRL